MISDSSAPVTGDINKVAAIVAYFGILGWLISYFALYKQNKTMYATYHMRQTLMLAILGIGLGVLNVIIGFTAPVLWFITSIAGLVLFILWIIGLIGAIQGEMKPIPLIGDMAQRTFANID